MARIVRTTNVVQTYDRKFVPSFIVRGTTNPEVNYIPLVTRTYPYNSQTYQVTGIIRNSSTNDSVIIPANQFEKVLVGDIVTSATGSITITARTDIEILNCYFFQDLPFIIYPPSANVTDVRIGDVFDVYIPNPAFDSNLPVHPVTNPQELLQYQDYVVDNIDYANRKIYYSLASNSGDETLNLFTSTGICRLLIKSKVRVISKNSTTKAITINSTFTYPSTHTPTTTFDITFNRSLLELPVTIFRINVLDLNQPELNVEIADINFTNLPVLQTSFDSSKPFCNFNLSNFTYLNMNTRRYNVDAQLNSIGFPVSI